MSSPKISIIIPFPKDNDFSKESIKHCLALDYPNYEILVLPDGNEVYSDPKIKVIPTGKIGPSEKRDLALKYATGEILAFIDDDAYPTKDWLTNAARHFETPSVAAVGGPAVTPPGDGLLRKASGLIFSSFMGSGSMTYRYIPGKARKVDDYPSCNFIIRMSVFRELGGFDSAFWPGEDTKLCLELTKKLGKEIVYDPQVLVYHHRRKVFKQHLKQVWGYAIHRGYFAKIFPQTSLRLSYFLPSILTLGIIVGIPLSFLSPLFKLIYLGVLGLYLLLALLTGILSKDIRLAPLVFSGIVATHLTYGIGILKGLTTRRMVR